MSRRGQDTECLREFNEVTVSIDIGYRSNKANTTSDLLQLELINWPFWSRYHHRNISHELAQLRQSVLGDLQDGVENAVSIGRRYNQSAFSTIDIISWLLLPEISVKTPKIVDAKTTERESSERLEIDSRNIYSILKLIRSGP